MLTVNEVRGEEGYNKSDDPAADRLAIGTNPKTLPAPNAPPAQESPPNGEAITHEAPIISAPEVSSPAQAIAPVNEVILAGEALVRKEVAALRRLHVRHADDPAAFRKAVAAFYGGFASEVSRKLGVTKDQAKAWCRSRSVRIDSAEDVSVEIDALEIDMEAEIENAAIREHADGDA